MSVSQCRQCVATVGLLVILGSALLPLYGQDGKSSPKVTLVVGNWLAGEGPVADKPSPLKAPFGVDFDSKGNMYLGDIIGRKVQKFLQKLP